MSGYELCLSTLDEGADASRDAGDQIAGLEVADPLTTAAQAMPGSSSASALSQLAGAWGEELSGLARDCQALGRAMGKAASSYRHVEGTTQDVMQGAAQRPGQVP